LRVRWRPRPETTQLDSPNTSARCGTSSEENQKLAASNLKGMVLKSAGQIRFQMQMLRLMPYLPGKNRMIRRITEPIRKAATAITLEDCRIPARR
jgi:hypothetical protein